MGKSLLINFIQCSFAYKCRRYIFVNIFWHDSVEELFNWGMDTVWKCFIIKIRISLIFIIILYYY